MGHVRTAKLFRNGASQAVRLPAEFRFEGSEVFIRRDPVTGDVILSNRDGPRDWDEFYDLMETIDVPADFMAERPMNTPPPPGGVFDDER